MGLAIFALLISIATGWAVLVCLWPRAHGSASGLALRLAVAGGLGLFVSSVIYLICLTTGFAERGWVISIDLAVCAGASILARRRARWAGLAQKEHWDPAPSNPVRAVDWLLALGLFSAVVVNVRVWIVRFGDRPLGFWDAFAIWNLKARFFYLDSGEYWLRAFSDTISWSHTDYPLLLPLSVARLWAYGGGGGQAIPALLAVFFAGLIGVLLFGAVASARGRAMGFLSVLALLGTPAFMGQVAWQLADIPMSCFLATALALVVMSHREGDANPGLLILAGLAAGTAAWTKNEGLLFALAIALGLILADVAQEFRRSRNRTRESHDGRALQESLRRASRFTMGLAVPVVVLLSMKTIVAGESDLAADFGVGSLARIFEFARHQEIVVSFGRALLILTGVPLLVLIVGLCLWGASGQRTQESQAILPAMIAIGLQLSGYYFVYLVTERDLAWHLETSNLRLFVQLWPSVLLLAFIALPRLGDRSATEAESE